MNKIKKIMLGFFVLMVVNIFSINSFAMNQDNKKNVEKTVKDELKKTQQPLAPEKEEQEMENNIRKDTLKTKIIKNKSCPSKMKNKVKKTTKNKLRKTQQSLTHEKEEQEINNNIRKDTLKTIIIKNKSCPSKMENKVKKTTENKLRKTHKSLTPEKEEQEINNNIRKDTLKTIIIKNKSCPSKMENKVKKTTKNKLRKTQQPLDLEKEEQEMENNIRKDTLKTIIIKNNSYPSKMENKVKKTTENKLRKTQQPLDLEEEEEEQEMENNITNMFKIERNKTKIEDTVEKTTKDKLEEVKKTKEDNNEIYVSPENSDKESSSEEKSNGLNSTMFTDHPSSYSHNEDE